MRRRTAVVEGRWTTTQKLAKGRHGTSDLFGAGDGLRLSGPRPAPRRRPIGTAPRPGASLHASELAMNASKPRTVPRWSLILLLALLPIASETGEVMPRKPGEKDRCPVCGMFVAPYPRWVAQVVFDDDSTVFFDGSKDMFKYLLDRDRFAPEKRQLKIAAIFVRSYYEGDAIPAATACFVIGSDVNGPMGSELVPHRTREEAKEFLRDHKGKKVVSFDEVTTELLRSLSAGRRE